MADQELREMIRSQTQALSEQRDALAKLVTLQGQVVANQERTIATQRKLFRVIGVLGVIYVALAIIPLWLKQRPKCCLTTS